MGYESYRMRWCRWCSTAYQTKRDIGRDGFCCPACRQAHYRAYKVWRQCRVISIRRGAASDIQISRRSVTHKNR